MRFIYPTHEVVKNDVDNHENATLNADNIVGMRRCVRGDVQHGIHFSCVNGTQIWWFNDEKTRDENWNKFRGVV